MSVRSRSADGRVPIGPWTPDGGGARRRARADVAIGIVVALAVLAAAPGLAMVAIAALIVLAGCLLSLLAGRLRARRRDRVRQPR